MKAFYQPLGFLIGIRFVLKQKWISTNFPHIQGISFRLIRSWLYPEWLNVNDCMRYLFSFVLELINFGSKNKKEYFKAMTFSSIWQEHDSTRWIFYNDQAYRRPKKFPHFSSNLNSNQENFFKFSERISFNFVTWYLSSSNRVIVYTENLFEILLNQPDIRLYLPFSDWFGTANWQCPFTVPNWSENSKYNLISCWFDKISKRFLCA